jgi:hypothetical protein
VVPSNIDGLTEEVGRLTKHVKQAIFVASAKDERRLKQCEDAIDRFGRLMTSLTEYMGLDVDDLEHFSPKPRMSETPDIGNHGMNVFYPRYREVGLGTMADNVTLCMAASPWNAGNNVQPPLENDHPEGPMAGDGEDATALRDVNVVRDEPVARAVTPDISITEPDIILAPDSGEATAVSALALTFDPPAFPSSVTLPIPSTANFLDINSADHDIIPVPAPASGEVSVIPVVGSTTDLAPMPLFVMPPVIPVVNLVHSTPVNSQEAATPAIAANSPA